MVSPILVVVCVHIYLLILEHSSNTLESDLQQLRELQRIDRIGQSIELSGTIADGNETTNSEIVRVLYTHQAHCQLKTQWENHLKNTNKVIHSPISALRNSKPDSTNSEQITQCVSDLGESGGTSTSWLNVALLDPESAQNRAQSITNSLLSLVLPFLYASMGALIYILRTISGELVAMRYSRARMTHICCDCLWALWLVSVSDFCFSLIRSALCPLH